MTGSLLVVTGPPGAGKSTVAHSLAARHETSAVIVGDGFFAFLARGAIAPWLPAAATQNAVVVDAAAGAAGRFARGGYATVYDGVVGPWFLEGFLAATGLDQLDYVILLPSVERCVERVVTRRDHGFTDVPATRKMHREFVVAEVAARHVLVDPPGVTTVADEILAAQSSGALRVEAP